MFSFESRYSRLDGSFLKSGSSHLKTSLLLKAAFLLEAASFNETTALSHDLGRRCNSRLFCYGLATDHLGRGSRLSIRLLVTSANLLI